MYTFTTGSNGSIVVYTSPLVSIMVDQQEKFVGKGIVAEFVGDAQEDRVVVKVLEEKLHSPENLLNNPKYRSMLLTSTYK